MKKTILSAAERFHIQRLIERTESFSHSFNRYANHLMGTDIDPNDFMPKADFLNGEFVEVNDEVQFWAYRTIMRAQLTLLLDDFNTKCKDLYATIGHDREVEETYDTESERGYWGIGVFVGRVSDGQGIYLLYSNQGGDYDYKTAKFWLIATNQQWEDASLLNIAKDITESIEGLCGPDEHTVTVEVKVPSFVKENDLKSIVITHPSVHLGNGEAHLEYTIKEVN